MWMIVLMSNGRTRLATDKPFSDYHAAVAFARDILVLPDNPPPPQEPAWLVLPFDRAMEITQRNQAPGPQK
jgi:hypothetical protein